MASMSKWLAAGGSKSVSGGGGGGNGASNWRRGVASDQATIGGSVKYGAAGAAEMAYKQWRSVSGGVVNQRN